MKRFILYFLFATFSFCTVLDGFAQSNSEGSSCAMCKNGRHQNENPYKLDFRSEIPFIISGVSSLGLESISPVPL